MGMKQSTDTEMASILTGSFTKVLIEHSLLIALTVASSVLLVPCKSQGVLPRLQA